MGDLGQQSSILTEYHLLITITSHSRWETAWWDLSPHLTGWWILVLPISQASSTIHTSYKAVKPLERKDYARKSHDWDLEISEQIGRHQGHPFLEPLFSLEWRRYVWNDRVTLLSKYEPQKCLKVVEVDCMAQWRKEWRKTMGKQGASSQSEDLEGFWMA